MEFSNFPRPHLAYQLKAQLPEEPSSREQSTFHMCAHPSGSLSHRREGGGQECQVGVRLGLLGATRSGSEHTARVRPWPSRCALCDPPHLQSGDNQSTPKGLCETG